MWFPSTARVLTSKAHRQPWSGRATRIDGAEEKPEVDDLLLHLYRLLLEFSESCFGVDHETRADLQRASDNFLRCRRWLDPSVAAEFASAINRLRNVSK